MFSHSYFPCPVFWIFFYLFFNIISKHSVFSICLLGKKKKRKI